MRSIFAFLLMLMVPLALFWVPVPGAGSLIGGFLGGYVDGSPGRALVLAILPAFMLAVVAFVVLTGVGLPIVGGLLAGVAVAVFAAHSVALLVGAILGGLFAQHRQARIGAAI
ncbi:MAG: hypothetical protein JO023_10125 [Chloroflexi bacterium]|nr:hypothetical protein [Chloroflexota bacterium]